MAIDLKFKSLTKEQGDEFVQLSAEISKIRDLILQKQSSIDVLRGDVINLQLEISEREKKLQQLDI